MPQDTSNTTRINLICEDRQTGKKCQFNDLAIQLLPDGQIPLAELISSNISLHYFLSNSMIFQHTPDIDIVLGFYPSKELKTLALPVSRSAGVSTLSFKFEKIPTFSSDSEPTPVLNQNQILSNKIINNPNQSKGKQQIFKLLSSKTQEESLKISLQGSGNASSISSQDSIENQKKERQFNRREQEENIANNSQISGDKKGKNENKIQKDAESADKQIYKQEEQEDDGMQDESKESDSLEAREPHIEVEEPDICGTPSEEEKASSCSLNRKRRASEALESSKNGSPCISFTENDQQNPKLPPPLLKKNHLSTATTNTDSSILQSSSNNNLLNNSINLSNLQNKQLSSFKVNSSFNAYNPILSSSGIKIGDIGQQPGITYNQVSQFQQIQQAATSNNSSNILLTSCSGSSRQSRNKERTIKEAIEMVTKWRDLQEDYRQKHQVKGLQEVADELNISKKVLDYYFQELRTAEFFGFDFDSNLSSKMGILRKYIDEQKKNHENKNKNFKITRNLQFKYRLKEDGGNLMNTGSTASTLSSSSGIENYHLNTHQSKINQMNSQYFPSNEEINSNLFQNAMAINRLVKGNNNNSSVDYSSIQDDMGQEKNNNGIDKTINIKGQSVPPPAPTSCSSFQEVLSKNSPLFLNFFNTHNNTTQASSFTPSIVKTPKMSQKQPLQQPQSLSQLTQQQKPLQTSQTQQSSAMISSNFKPNPTNNNPLNVQPKSSQPSQSLQQTTQQLAGLDKALLLLELINQTTQQSQPNVQNNPSSSTANPSSNMLDDVFNFMKLLTSGNSEAEGSTGQTQQAATPTPSSTSQNINQPLRSPTLTNNIDTDQASFLQSQPSNLADAISNE